MLLALDTLSCCGAPSDDTVCVTLFWVGWGVASICLVALLFVSYSLFRCRRSLSKLRSVMEQSVEVRESDVIEEREEREVVAAEEIDEPIVDVEMGLFSEYVDSSMTNSDKLFLKRLIGYIEQNIDSSELAVNNLCDFMGVTPLVLNKKLKSLVDMTANVFIRTVRLRRAAQLLRTARYTVADVTYDVGFGDLRYFRECFKREYGVLPQEYKDQSVSRVEQSQDIDAQSHEDEA